MSMPPGTQPMDNQRWAQSALVALCQPLSGPAWSTPLPAWRRISPPQSLQDQHPQQAQQLRCWPQSTLTSPTALPIATMPMLKAHNSQDGLAPTAKPQLHQVQPGPLHLPTQ